MEMRDKFHVANFLRMKHRRDGIDDNDVMCNK